MNLKIKNHTVVKTVKNNLRKKVKIYKNIYLIVVTMGMVMYVIYVIKYLKQKNY